MGKRVTEGPVTVLFTDVEGSTALHAAKGDAEAQRILRACEELVRVQVRAHRGRAIKSLGDGVLAIFASPRKAVACALAIQGAVIDHGHWHPEQEVKVRIGLHTGEVSEVAGDILGGAVNAAARICAKAKGGEVLVSDVVRQLCGSVSGITVHDHGRVTLKGFPDRWRLYRVAPTPSIAVARAGGLTPFVGRESERTQLRGLIERAGAGHGGLVMIGGEPGVGKTRFSQEIAAEAQHRGFRVGTGHCYETGGDLPYMPWVEMLETAAKETPADVFRQSLGEAAPELARIAPRLRRMFPEIPPPLELPPDQQRRHMFNCIGDYITGLAALQPRLFVIEDLHWADESTLLFLGYLAERLPNTPALVIGTYRESPMDVTPQLAETLSTFVRRHHARLISLERHSEQEIGVLLRALSGHRPPPAVTAAIYTETDGNAFFVEEVFRHLAESDSLLDPQGEFRSDLRIEELDVPENVRLVIGQRLDRLTEATRRVLTMAAVIGRHCGLPLLEAVAELDEDTLLDAVDEAERARVVSSEPIAGETSVRFAHELIRQTLLSRVNSLRRERYHLRVADALERDHATDLEAFAAEIAAHLTRAGKAADTVRTADYLVLAGDQAQTASAFEEALRSYRQALSILPPQEACLRADALVKVGLSLRSLCRWDDAMVAWNEALSELERLGDVQAVAFLCGEFGNQLGWAYRFQELLTVAGRGLTALGDQPSPRRAHLLSLRSTGQSHAGDFEGAAADISEAKRLAEELGDAPMLGRVWFGEEVHHYFFMQPPASMEAGRRAVQKLQEVGSPWHLCNAMAFLDVAYVFQGRFRESDEVQRQLEPLADRLGHTAAAATCRRSGFPKLAACRADLDRLEELSALQSQAARDIDNPGWLAYASTLNGIVAFWRGHWDDARMHMEEGAHLAMPGFWFGVHHGFLMLVLASLDLRKEAQALLAEMRPVLPKADQANLLGQWSLAILAAEGAGILGDPDAARALHPIVVEALATGTVMRQYDGGLLQRAAGMAASAAGLWEKAEEHFEIALRQTDELPHLLERPQVRHSYAAFLRDRGASGDLDRARALLDEAVAEYHSIGMSRHEAMAAALLSSLS